jgi:hypothetical protein
MQLKGCAVVDITPEKQAARSMSSFDAEIDARKRTHIVPLICVCLETDPDGKAAGKGLRLAALSYGGVP